MDRAFPDISSWIGQGPLPGGIGCFLQGMVSVLFSPCHLASIPLKIGHAGNQDHHVEGKKQPPSVWSLPSPRAARSAHCSAARSATSALAGASPSAYD